MQREAPPHDAPPPCPIRLVTVDVDAKLDIYLRSPLNLASEALKTLWLYIHGTSMYFIFMWHVCLFFVVSFWLGKLSLRSWFSLLWQENHERYETCFTWFHLKKLITLPNYHTHTQEYISQLLYLTTITGQVVPLSSWPWGARVSVSRLVCYRKHWLCRLRYKRHPSTTLRNLTLKTDFKRSMHQHFQFTGKYSLTNS
jgi:hypothetical protein